MTKSANNAAERAESPPTTPTRRGEMQGDRLEGMNQILRDHDLPVLLRTGTYQNGEYELVRIVGYAVNAHYATVEYESIHPDGTRHSFFIQYGVKTGSRTPCVIIPVLNGTHLVLTRSHRPALLHRKRSWIVEFPRGFIVTGLTPTIVDRKLREHLPASATKEQGHIAIGAVGRKIVSLLQHPSVSVESFQPMNLLPDETTLTEEASLVQDSGRSGDATHYWLLNLKTDDLDRVMRETQGPRQMKLCFIPWADAVLRSRELDIVDHATMTGLFLYLKATGRIRFDQP